MCRGEREREILFKTKTNKRNNDAFNFDLIFMFFSVFYIKVKEKKTWNQKVIHLDINGRLVKLYFFYKKNKTKNEHNK